MRHHRLAWEGVTIDWYGDDPTTAGRVTMHKPPQAHRTEEEGIAAMLLEDMFAADAPVPIDGSPVNPMVPTYPLTSWYGLYLAVRNLAAQNDRPQPEADGPRPPFLGRLPEPPEGAVV